MSLTNSQPMPAAYEAFLNTTHEAVFAVEARVAVFTYRKLGTFIIGFGGSCLARDMACPDGTKTSPYGLYYLPSRKAADSFIDTLQRSGREAFVKNPERFDAGERLQLRAIEITPSALLGGLNRHFSIRDVFGEESVAPAPQPPQPEILADQPAATVLPFRQRA
jgi:hypothetical protein